MTTDGIKDADQREIGLAQIWGFFCLKKVRSTDGIKDGINIHKRPKLRSTDGIKDADQREIGLAQIWGFFCLKKVRSTDGIKDADQREIGLAQIWGFFCFKKVRSTDGINIRKRPLRSGLNDSDLSLK